MRRALVFAAVLGTGVAALWLADARSRARMAQAAERRPEAAPLDLAAEAPSGAPQPEPPQPEPSSEPPPPQDDDEKRSSGLIISGFLSTNVFPQSLGVHRHSHRLQGTFEALDKLGERYLVRDLETRVLSPGGDLVETIVAKRARLRLEFGDEENPLGRIEVAERGKVALEEVVVTRHTGHPLAPLTFSAPSLTAYLADDRLESGEGVEVRVTGEGLLATGAALRYEGQTGELALDGGGALDLQRPGEDPVRFLAPTGGPLEVVRTGDPAEGLLEVRATQGARLELAGASGAQVDAQRIRLRGRVEGGSFLLEEGDATGEVVATRGPERFRGEEARLFTDEAGRVVRASLDREPEARLQVVDEDGALHHLTAGGGGPLTVWLDEGVERRFLLEGPGQAEVEGQDLVVRAEGSLEGSAAADLSTVMLLAREGVVVTRGEESRLDTDSLDVLALAGGEAVDLRCAGATRLTTRDEDGALATFDARDEADLRLRGGVWTVPLARGVELSVQGEDPVRAIAGVARDLDPTTQTGTLEEGVSWIGAFGEADASRVLLRGPRSGVLYGLAGSPARFRALPQLAEPAPDTELQLATFSALTIDVTPTAVAARGEARLHLEDPSRAWSLDAATVRLSLPSESLGADLPGTFAFEADTVTRAELTQGGVVTSVSCGRLVGGGLLHEPPGEEPYLEVTWAVATGGVEVERAGPAPLFARGERAAFQGGSARLTPAAGERVEFSAPATEDAAAWRFEADALGLEGDTARAERPTARYEGALLPGPPVPGAVLQPATIEAASLQLTPGSARFEGGVLAQGCDPEGIPATLEAEGLRVAGKGRAFALGSVREFEAWGGFRAVYGGLALALGERCEVTPSRVELHGTEDRPAALDMAGMALRSPRVEVDLERFLLESDRGELSSVDGWRLGYAALQPVERDGETMMLLVAPRYDDGLSRARANFAAAWIFAERWASRGRERLFGAPRSLDEEPTTAPPSAPPDAPQRPGLVHNVFGDLVGGQTAELLRAVHIEGSLEVTEDERTVARASEAWLDLESQRGWLRDATLVARMDLSGRDGHDRVRVRAAELVTKGDGSLRAADATMTTSTHDVPGYVIQTGELVLAPRADGLWSFSAKPNRIRFESGIALPLPPLGNLVLDGGGGFVGFEARDGGVRTIENLTLGDDARHGTTVGTSLRYPIGDLGKKLGRFFGFDGSSVHGDWATEASYLSSRGFLLGTGLELRQRSEEAGSDLYWFNLYAKGIDDGGEDRGLLRVDEADRDGFRTWIYGRGRYPFSRTEWIETQFSTQSDPGVQAEFYESDYLEYERRENDVYWRRGDGANLYSLRAEGRVDSYRTEVEELPSLGLYGGETPVAHLGPVPLLWRRSLDVAYLKRREGDLEYEDPFFDSLGAPDPYGEREVLRAATAHRLATPLRTGLAAVTATPWVEAQLAAWDEGVDEDLAPRRAALLGGLDLSTTLTKITEAGYRHTLSPTLHFRGDLALEEENGRPVRFDELEDTPEGDEAGAGLRALWSHPELPHELDLSLRALQRRDRGELESHDRLELLGGYSTEAFGRPLGLLSDMRLDPDSGATIYGRSTLAVAPTDDWLLEVSHRRGRGADGRGLFETASFDARWTIDEKWELQLGQDINLLGTGALRSQFVVRRFGADFLFELEVMDRAGEGGTTVRVNFAPMFLWKRRPLGILERGR